MTRKVRVPIFGTAPAKGVMIDADATQGATIGANVYNPDGSLFVPAATPAPGQTYPVTVWQRIMYVPPNVVALEKAVGAGLFAVTGPATGAFREITAGDGIDVSDGDGVAGDPIVAHADTSNVTDVSTSNTGGVFIQNLAFTFDQFGHVTGVTVDSQTVQHNDTGGIQGGTSGEYYHQTASQNANSASLASMETGFGVKTAANTWVERSFPNGTGYTWTNANGVAGNPTLALSPNLQSWSGIAPSSKLNTPSGTADTTTFARGDGQYSSELINPAGSLDLAITTYGGAGRISMTRYNGTVGSPATVAAGQNLFFLAGSAYDGSVVVEAASIQFVAGGTWSGSSRPVQINFRNTGVGESSPSTRWNIASGGHFRPSANNSYDVGEGSSRVREYFGVNGAINTSDEREKTPLLDMTPAEIACAIEIASLPCVYKWLSAVEEKGEAARLHISPGVQSVIAVMERHGLDPFAYGFVCYDKWDEQPEVWDEWPARDEVRDEETGDVILPAVEAGRELVQPYRAAGDRYSLRPSELAWFVIRGQAARQDALEARIAALEA